jgi:hypothetical protein
MNKMMMWFDGSSSPLAEKVAKAAMYYERKYHAKPRLCWVHVSSYEPGCVVAGIKIEAKANLLKHDLWLGEGE